MTRAHLEALRETAQEMSMQFRVVGALLAFAAGAVGSFALQAVLA